MTSKIHPPLESINKLKVKPTNGELHLLNFLEDNLDENYEVYFQPWINGDNPDIVIMRKNSGVMIIEVKDWDLNHYQLNEKKNWILRKDGTILKSPLAQVLSYKNNLFELHIDDLLRKFIYNSKLFSIVNLCVYFHNATEKGVNSFLKHNFYNDKKYIKWISYFDLLGNDSLKKENLLRILSKRWLDRYSKLFDNDIYDSFKRYLQPTLHTLEQGIPLYYNKEQSSLIISSNVERKIKGIAGSGKAMVLAKRAVNAHIRTNDRVLILCYNITIRNYLKDKINEVKENFNWDSFHINNYHDFITQQMNNCGIPLEIPKDFDNWEKSEREKFFNSFYFNEKLFDEVKDKILKYKSIFIDEAQDYHIEWLNIIKKYFLEDNGEYVLFADEKQNIYSNELETDIEENNDRRPRTNIKGPWNESLKKTYRLSKRISEMANEFQKIYFSNKYYLDYIEIQQEFNYGNESFKYIYLNENCDSKSICDIIISNIKELNIHPNEVCVLAYRIEQLVEIDLEYRKISHEKTLTTVENYEIKKKLCYQVTGNARNEDIQNGIKFIFDSKTKNKIKLRLERELERVRKNKRLHFWMNPGIIKMSTIHSFKGWEINTLFLIIEKESSFLSDELIYTGLTRCRNNLIILNLGNSKYDDFFNKFSFD